VKEFTGNIEAVDTVQINPRVGGLVVKVHVADGAEVKAGQPILDIDDAPLKATVARAKAELARAEARLALAKLQFERGKQLVQGQVISRQQFDDQESGVSTAEADVAAAKAALLTAELDLGYAQVTAPIAGRIGKIQTSVGNLVQGGGPVPPTYITTLVSVDPVYVTFDVDEQTWQQTGGRLRAATTGGEAMKVAVALMGETGFPHVGHVVFVNNQIDGSSGAIRVRATVANPDRRLTPGAFARIRLETGPARPVVLIHERAVLSQLNTRYVLGVTPDGATSFRPVQLGDSVGHLRIVEQGLSADDRIAVLGLAKVFYPGMHIAPQEASMETLEVAQPAGAPAAAGHPETSKSGASPAPKPSDGAKPTETPKAAEAPKAGTTEGTKP
jgi:RND family efflux transporter MFP subunit